MALAGRGGDGADEDGCRLDRNKSLDESEDLVERDDVDGVAEASLLELGILHEYGLAVPHVTAPALAGSPSPAGLATAVYFYRAVAKIGSIRAAYNLALMYLYGCVAGPRGSV
eukprot:CAMPEP_0194341158 /NCGR_PEP_ID=MMETSP0171-20130528/88792_1 /TAXON_ID=218684 /ORGANISM="Corethron pennatum, Strain L29A3" /LENGTH=112 /DNA_ID=CAMNT_0039106395 /DNA_START=12 /DNA_END=345 /DNA_ORIENTATION=+